MESRNTKCRALLLLMRATYGVGERAAVTPRTNVGGQGEACRTSNTGRL